MKKIKHFLDLDQINAEELRSIVDLSKSYKQGITSAICNASLPIPFGVPTILVFIILYLSVYF